MQVACAAGLGALLLLPAAPQAQTGNPTHDSVAALGEQARQTEFLRALRAGGNACPGVVLTFFAGFDAARTAAWDVRCQGGDAYRIVLPADRFARPSLLACGAVPGGCFRPVAAAPRSTGPRQEAICRQACGSQPAAALQACMAQCISGGGVTLADAPPPAGGRFGAVYTTDPPTAAFGFANGDADRLAANLSAVRACQQRAGRVPCHFRQEIVSACGALAMARGTSPGALVMTEDLATQRLARASIAAGATQAEAESAALAACRPAEAPGVTCRIVASGC
ncbi:MAG: DUF4189 domain-containing protein [Acetobacteraceae bacterium]